MHNDLQFHPRRVLQSYTITTPWTWHQAETGVKTNGVTTGRCMMSLAL